MNKSQYGNFYSPIMAGSCHGVVLNFYGLDLMFHNSSCKILNMYEFQVPYCSLDAIILMLSKTHWEAALTFSTQHYVYL